MPCGQCQLHERPLLFLGGAGRKDEKALNEIIDTMLEKGVETFLPQALSNVAWGCATLEHNNEAFLQVGFFRKGHLIGTPHKG